MSKLIEPRWVTHLKYEREGIPEREVAKTWEDREITVPKIQHRIIARVAHCNLSVS